MLVLTHKLLFGAGQEGSVGIQGPDGNWNSCGTGHDWSYVMQPGSTITADMWINYQVLSNAHPHLHRRPASTASHPIAAGDYYGYYVCRGRQHRLCDLPHLPVAQVEDAICRTYRTLRLPVSFLKEIGTLLQATMAEKQRLTQELHDSLTKQLAKLEVREERLIDLAADGLLTRSKIQERSNAIQLEKARIHTSLSDTSAQLELGVERLRTCLDLAQNVPALYERLTDQGRRQANHTFYRCFYLDELSDQSQIIVGDSLLNPPFDEIQDAADVYGAEDVKGLDRYAAAFNRIQTPVLAHIFPVTVSSKRVLVGAVGIEPTTARV